MEQLWFLEWRSSSPIPECLPSNDKSDLPLAQPTAFSLSRRVHPLAEPLPQLCTSVTYELPLGASVVGSFSVSLCAFFIFYFLVCYTRFFKMALVFTVSEESLPRSSPTHSDTPIQHPSLKGWRPVHRPPQLTLCYAGRWGGEGINPAGVRAALPAFQKPCAWRHLVPTHCQLSFRCEDSWRLWF